MERSRISEVYFRIEPNDVDVQFTSIQANQMYESKGTGFTRKALMTKQFPKSDINIKHFQDLQFKIQQSSAYRIVNLYNLYNKQIALFPEQQQSSSFIEKQKSYNSFMAESGVISYDYFRTLFITQNVNQTGYYQYFIKRDGEYYLQFCDDYIPIQRNTKKIIWNLQLSHPWQIIMMKAWIKQCGSIQAAYEMQPFRLLQAFGLPQYRLFNFRKQLSFIKNQRINSEKKKQNQFNFVMNKNDVIIIGKTIDDQRVRKVGLVPNFAAYRLLRINKPQQQGLYRIYSSLPCQWTGSYNPIVNTQLNRVYNRQMYLDLQRNFLITQKQLTTYFNKFYVIPFQLSQPERYITQDCIQLTCQRNKPFWLSFDVRSNEGMLAISIQLPKIRDKMTGKYPQYRYFLTKNLNQQQISRSHYRTDIRGSQRQGNMYIQSNCDKWDYYAIDYMQGYHNNSSFFCKVVQGFYVLYIDADYIGTLNVRFDSFVVMTKPEIYNPSQQQIKQIFDSTFFTISQDLGVQASLSNSKFEQSISLNNSFQQIGYGIIAIKTLTKAKHRIAMRIFPNKLRELGLRLLSHYDNLQEDKSNEKNLILISSKGRPQIIVLQKIDNKSENTLGKVFPPQGTIQFFHLTPNLVYNFN